MLDKKTINLETSFNHCIICDIDGTLALKGDRGIFEYDKVEKDIPNGRLIRILKSLGKDNKIFIFSGREDTCHKETSHWLKSFNIPFDYLVMRKAKDFRDDTVIKKEMYDEHIKDKYDVLAVFDDRPKVIRMWKELNLFVLDCNLKDSREEF